MTNVASDLYRMLLKAGCINFGVFKLKKGKLSPYSMDLRLIFGVPDGMDKVVRAYESVVKDRIGIENFDRIAGVPIAGMVFASVLSHKLSKPFLYIKAAAETHGREKKIEGMLAPGDRVLVVDDLVASGKSLLETACLVRGEGATVSDALVLVDREEGGVEKLAKVGVKLHAFAKTSEIVKEMYETNLIDKRRFEEIVEKRTSEEPDSETTAVSSD